MCKNGGQGSIRFQGDNKELMNDMPAFVWSDADIPGTCMVFDCNHTVPVNIPQPLIDLFHAHAKMLYESPCGLHSVDFIEMFICLQLGLFQQENCTRQTAMSYGYPEINFEQLVPHVLKMKVNINIMKYVTARQFCTVWDYLIDELKMNGLTLEGPEKEEIFVLQSRMQHILDSKSNIVSLWGLTKLFSIAIVLAAKP
jgi:hypothetical protein